MSNKNAINIDADHRCFLWICEQPIWKAHVQIQGHCDKMKIYNRTKTVYLHTDGIRQRYGEYKILNKRSIFITLLEMWKLFGTTKLNFLLLTIHSCTIVDPGIVWNRWVGSKTAPFSHSSHFHIRTRSKGNILPLQKIHKVLKLHHFRFLSALLLGPFFIFD